MAEFKEHLEKIVFEVYGADEAKRKLEDIAKAEDKYAKSTKGVIRAAKERAKEEEKAAQKIADSQKKIREETQKTMKIAGAGLLALAGLAAQASADMETANGKVERSFRKVGASSGELSKALAQVDADARRFGLGLADQRVQLSNLLDATGDQTKALKDLKLANDIAATGDLDLTQAVELLTKARKGEVAELARLDGFNKTNIAALQAITTDADRAEAAIKDLTKAYGGAAKELKDTNTALQNIKEAGTDILAVLGDVGGGLINRVLGLGNAFNDKQITLDNFALGLRNFARDAKEASTYAEAFFRFRGQDGGAFGNRTFMDFVGDVDTENALAEAARAPGPRQGSGRYGGAGANGGLDATRQRLKDRNAARTKPSAKKASGGKAAADEGPIDGSEGAFDFEAAAEERRLARIKWEAERTAQEGRAHSDRMNRKKREEREELELIEQMEEAKLEVRAQTAQAYADVAINSAAQIGGTIAQLAESEKAGLAIDAVVASARAAIAWGFALSPPPVGGPQYIPGAIGLTTAAANAALVAGVGIAQPGGKGGGANSAPASSMSRDRERVGQMAETGVSGQAQQALVVNINSAFPPNPQQARQLVDAVERERRNRS